MVAVATSLCVAIVVVMYYCTFVHGSPCFSVVLDEQGSHKTVSSSEAAPWNTCWDVRAKNTDMHVQATVTQLHTELGRAIITYRANGTDDRVLAAYSGTACAYYAWRGSVYPAPSKLDSGACTYVSEGSTLRITMDRDQRVPFDKEDVFEIKAYATKMRLFNVKEIM